MRAQIWWWRSWFDLSRLTTTSTTISNTQSSRWCSMVGITHPGTVDVDSQRIPLSNSYDLKLVDDWVVWPSSQQRLETRQSKNAVVSRKVRIISSCLQICKEEFPWMYGKVSRGYWLQPKNQRYYLDWLFRVLNYNTPEDWYRVTVDDFLRNHGAGVLFQNGKSPTLAVLSNYPEHVPHRLLPWLFSSTPRGYFNRRENRRKYIDWLTAKVGVEQSDLESLECRHFFENSGSALLGKYGGSPHSVIQSLKAIDNDTNPPDNKTLANNTINNPLRRSQKPRNFWDSIENQRAFLDSVAAKIGLGTSDLTGWYGVSHKTLKKLGCSSVLRNHSNSPYELLRHVYPEHPWLPWRFQRLPHQYGKKDDEDEIEKVLCFIEKERHLTSADDWHRVSKLDLQRLGVYTAVNQFGGLYNALVKSRGGGDGGGSEWRESEFKC